jgi:hypothetical protein
MDRRRGAAIALVIIAALALPACAKASHGGEATAQPARVEKVAGSDVSRVVLTKKANERLGVTTTPVREPSPPAPGRTVVDYSALIYDANGAANVYTNPEPLVYVRAPVTVDTIQGDQALLATGPPVGTAVVTVGAPELYGIDSGIGGNE